MNGIYNADDMQTMATEMRVLQQQMVSDLNQKYTSQYLFSGSGGSAPFSLDADGKLLFRGLDVNDPANGAQFKAWCAEEIPTDIGAPFDTSLCALNYVGYGQDADGLSNNAISLLGQMADAIEAGTFEGDAGRYLDKIQSSHQRLVVGLTELDARANHLTVAQDRLETTQTNLYERIGDASKVDSESALMNYQSIFYSYQVALRLGSTLLTTSFVDFLGRAL